MYEDEEEITFIIILTASIEDENLWLLTVEPLRHVIGHADWFELLEPYSFNKSIELGDKYPLNIKGVRTITIELKGAIQKIGNVLFVLGLKNNLLSISLLRKKNPRTIFNKKGYFYILDTKKNGVIIVKGIEINDLYRLLSNPIISNNDVKTYTTINIDNNKPCHVKYRHISSDRLKELHSSKRVDGLPNVVFHH